MTDVPRSPDQRAEDEAAALAKIWKENLPDVLARVGVIEKAIVALLEGRMTAQQVDDARRQAHTLAGSVSLFGFTRASALAKELEAGFPAAQQDAPRLAGVAVQLRTELVNAMPAPQSAREDTAAAAPSAETRDAKWTVDVVIVDDDPALSNVLVHGLRARGYTVEWFADGTKAAAALGGADPKVRPGVLLLDVDLPGLDGHSLLRQLAQDGLLERTRVIMLTLRSNEEEVLMTLKSGAFDHVAKPFSMPILLERVRRALETPH